jgi:hypothetical protein
MRTSGKEGLVMSQHANYIEYNFPKTIFVDTNTAGEQLEHVLSEVDEVVEAFEIADSLDGLDGISHINDELADLTHSLETMWRILEAEHGQDYVQAIFAKVEAKNRARGYYNAPVPPVAAQEQSR